MTEPTPRSSTVGLTRSGRLAHLIQVQRAFFRIGWLTLISYPAAMLTRQLSLLVTVAMYYFLSQLVEDTPLVGGDYFTYVILGILVTRLLDGGLTGFGFQIQEEIQTGRLEGYLVEPVRWAALPFGLMQFPIVERLVTSLVALAVAIPFGLAIRPAGIVPAIAMLALGVAATASIGLLNSSIRILSKRSDPLGQLYQVAAVLFAGTFFPIDQLPAWIRPVSYAIPHTYVIAGARRLLMPDGADVAGPDLALAAGALAAWCVVFYAAGLLLYSKVMAKGRELGVLAGY
jgi:ABC-type uncharacterized transport system permease subunit